MPVAPDEAGAAAPTDGPMMRHVDNRTNPQLKPRPRRRWTQLAGRRCELARRLSLALVSLRWQQVWHFDG
jgi:hypothetical protein